MAAHKLDQLFKRKLDKHASVPSNDAWAKMETMLDKPARKPVWFYYKVAAAILLLFITGWVTYSIQIDNVKESKLTVNDVISSEPIESTSKNKLASSSSKNVKNTNQVLQVKKEELNPLKSKHSRNPKEQLAIDKQKKSGLKVDSQLEIILDNEVTTSQTMIALNEDVTKAPILKKVELINAKGSNNDVKPKKKRLPIKIIYKRGKKTQQKALLAQNDTTDRKKFNFNSIIDATKNISSGDLLADIRDAKDNLFSQGLDFKKSERLKNKNSNK